MDTYEGEMSIKSIRKNHLDFEENIKELITYGIGLIIDDFNKTKNKISRKEKTILIESLLLRSCAYWEKFIEKDIILLIDLEKDKFIKYYELTPKTNLNLKMIRAILYGDKYLDFHDIKHYKSLFSKIIVDKYNSFKRINCEQMKKIKISYTLRNYLSHYSEYSKKILFKMYKNNYTYRYFQEPGLFLLKEKGKHFENLLHNYVLVSVNMKNIFKGR